MLKTTKSAFLEYKVRTKTRDKWLKVNQEACLIYHFDCYAIVKMNPG